MEDELTVRLAMYRKGELIDHFDVSLDKIEQQLRWFAGAVDDEGADRVRITLYDNDRRVTAWTSKIDLDFPAFMENLAEELLSERLVCELERLDDGTL